MRRRLVAIDAWRFLFALLIIWHHLSCVGGHLHALGYCAVSFFLIASGFLSAGSDTSNIRRYYVRKFFRIFPIYWIALAIALIETIPTRSAWTPAAVWDILQHFFLLQAYSSSFHSHPMFHYLNSPAWFLCVLVLFYAILPLCQRWQRRHPTGFAIGVAVYSVVAVAVTWMCFDGAYWVRVNMPLVRISECLLGMVLAEALKGRTLPDIHKYLSVGVLALFFLLAYNIPNQFIRPYLSVPIMAYLFLAFLSCKENRVLMYISKWGGVSMEIYLFHWLIIRGLEIVEGIVHSTLPAWLFVCAVYVLTLSAAVLYHRFIATRIEALERKVVSQL